MMKNEMKRAKIYQYYKMFLITLMVLVFLFYKQLTVMAVEFMVTDTNAVLYTEMQTGVYIEPDAESAAICILESNIPIQVTGITSNGWFRIELGGVYYIPGNALTNSDVGQEVASPANMYVMPSYIESLSFTVDSVEEVVDARDEALTRHASSIMIQSSTLSNEAIYNIFEEVFHKGTISYGQGKAYGISAYGIGSTTYITYYYMSTIEEEVFTEAAVAQLVPQFNKGSTYDKIKTVNDYICNTVEYSFETAKGQADYRSAYDALAYKTTVCSGYALLFQKFMDQMGIPCYYATGTMNGVGHAWNIVQLDGQWYHIDCTNADQSYGIERQFFLRGAGYAGPTWGDIAISTTDYKR